MKYAGSITIVDDEGNVAHEYEMTADQIIEHLLGYLGSVEQEVVSVESAKVVDTVLQSPMFSKKDNGGRKQPTCGKCGETGHNAKTCGRVKEGPVKTKVQEELDADARLRVKRMVEGGIDSDEIKKALKRADFDYTSKEVEEMIAWAAHE